MKILVIHGAGMNMRGKVQQEIFGTMTLAQYEEHIVSYAKDLGMQVHFFHSNIEGEVCNALYAAFDG
ncbi:MAG: type II 3-dehydroquinate dehydratase, partial [Burkholderiales bacterium]|nr:type II 3-dehydroquinate dehydratase [Burkholderiales bacterium]